LKFAIPATSRVPSVTACCVSTGDRRAGAAAAVAVNDVRIQKCCVCIIPWILTRDPRTGGIRNWGHSQAVKTHRPVCVSVCLSARISPEPCARSLPIFLCNVAYVCGLVPLWQIDDRPHCLSAGRGMTGVHSVGKV